MVRKPKYKTAAHAALDAIEAAERQPPESELVKALRFYANPDNWKEQQTGIGMMPSQAELDGGRMAREALSSLTS